MLSHYGFMKTAGNGIKRKYHKANNMKTKILTAVLFCIFVFSAFADELIDSVNQNAPPVVQVTWLADDVGWEYTPMVNYALTSVFTEFAYIPYGDSNRIVTVEVYDGLPSAGGRLLRSADFTPLADEFSGASFLPLNLFAGHTYFIGFRNVSGLPSNVTGEPDATILSPIYFSQDGSYSETEFITFDFCPILEFYGQESPSEAVAQLISIVKATSMNRIKKALLTSILLQAENAFSRNNTALGIRQLTNFKNQVRLQIMRTDSADANLFIETAQEMINMAEQQRNRHFNFRS